MLKWFRMSKITQIHVLVAVACFISEIFENFENFDQVGLKEDFAIREHFQTIFHAQLNLFSR